MHDQTLLPVARARRCPFEYQMMAMWQRTAGCGSLTLQELDQASAGCTVHPVSSAEQAHQLVATLGLTQLFLGSLEKESDLF
jgi:hypothetical protein